MRTIVDIPNDVIKSLAIICEKENKSRAVLIREAIDEYLAKKTSNSMEDAFGLWKGRKKDGLAYQEEIRSEWS